MSQSQNKYVRKEVEDLPAALSGIQIPLQVGFEESDHTYTDLVAQRYSHLDLYAHPLGRGILPLSIQLPKHEDEALIESDSARRTHLARGIVYLYSLWKAYQSMTSHRERFSDSRIGVRVADREG